MSSISWVPCLGRKAETFAGQVEENAKLTAFVAFMVFCVGAFMVIETNGTLSLRITEGSAALFGCAAIVGIVACLARGLKRQKYVEIQKNDLGGL